MISTQGKEGTPDTLQPVVRLFFCCVWFPVTSGEGFEPGLSIIWEHQYLTGSQMQKHSPVLWQDRTNFRSMSVSVIHNGKKSCMPNVIWYFC